MDRIKRLIGLWIYKLGYYLCTIGLKLRNVDQEAFVVFWIKEKYGVEVKPFIPSAAAPLKR